MSRFQSRILMMGLLATTAATAGADEPAPPYRVTVRKPEDRVSTRVEADRAVFTVDSPGGIGGAVIARSLPDWPREVVLRLRLRGMEELRIGVGSVTLCASVASHGERGTTLTIQVGANPATIVDRDSPYWTEVRRLDGRGNATREIPLEDGCFEVSLPPAVVGRIGPKFTLDWVDFYR